MLFPPQTLIIKQLFVIIIQRDFFEMQARLDAMRPMSGAGAQEGRQNACDHIGKLLTCPAKIFCVARSMMRYAELRQSETSCARAPLRSPGIF
ncbi:MAG: hypothetical protein ACI9SB_002054 [Candidatus Azotimanducaceae bacterium]|jgi:hypothetical protein